jgi:hypothetical protein
MKSDVKLLLRHQHLHQDEKEENEKEETLRFL